MKEPRVNCSNCGEDFDVSPFVKGVGVSKPPNWCKECRNLASLKSHHAMRCRRKGLTVFEFDFILAKQDGCCSICKIEFLTVKDARIDHDHKTKKIRGIICLSCNNLLGYLDDDHKKIEIRIITLQNMLKYVHGTCPIDREVRFQT